VTGEAEVKKEQGHEAPISEIQPTSQHEAENAVHEGNTAELKSKPAAEAEGSSEPTREEAKAATNTTESGVNAATEAVSNATSSVQDAASSARGQASEATGVYGGRRDRGDRSERGSVIGEPKSTIYIGNLFFDVTENDLVKELARFGTITKCRLMRDSRGLSKGYEQLKALLQLAITFTNICTLLQVRICRF
jgi:RNA recognition motif. (a.k.a. RRM, RBD, or RNP domain)